MISGGDVLRTNLETSEKLRSAGCLSHLLNALHTGETLFLFPLLVKEILTHVPRNPYYGP